MSQDVTKIAIRLPLPELDGKTPQERLNHLKPILGEPIDIEEYDGTLIYFNYKNYEFVTKDENRYAVDLILSEDNSYNHQRLAIKIGNLIEKIDSFAEKFGHKGQECLIVASTWYNGGDEPVEF